MNDGVFFFNTDRIELKEEGGDSFVYGYISTKDRDLVNDIVTDKCLKSMFNQMKGRTIKFDVEHESFKGAEDIDKEIAKTKNPIAKVDWFGLDANGLMVKSKLNPFHPRYKEVKGSIGGGFLDAFSIAYIPTDVEFEQKSDGAVRLLNDVTLLNVAFTGNPVNTKARITDVMLKSLEYLEGVDPATRSDVEDAQASRYADSTISWWKNELGELMKEGRITGEQYTSIVSKMDAGDYDEKLRSNWRAMQDSPALKAGAEMKSQGATHIPARELKLKNSEGRSMETKDTKDPGKVEIKADPEAVKTLGEKLDGISASLKSIEDRVSKIEGGAEKKSEPAKPADTKSMEDKVKELETQLKSLSAQPEYKGQAAGMKKGLDESEKKSVETQGPLDYIG